MRTLKRFNSDIEIYSIDEAFMDLSNFPDKEVEEVGKEIRNTVLQWTGIPTSIGIAKTKTLSKVANHIAKKKLSGVTSLIGIENIDPILEKTSKSINPYHISLLYGLPKIEFEAVLAHELLHVWIHENNINLESQLIEGFCNLGSYLIYNNDNTHFSTIHLQAMSNYKDIIYGQGYREMKSELENIGWKQLIANLKNN